MFRWLFVDFFGSCAAWRFLTTEFWWQGAPCSDLQQILEWHLGGKSMSELRPPRPRKGVKTFAASKSQKESLGESLGESVSQKRVSWRLRESKITCFLTPETRFWLVFGGSARTLGDSPRDSRRDSFLTFWAGEGFASSARRGGVAMSEC